MKIKTKNLVTFLKKSMMENDMKINECIFHFTPEGLKINTNSPSQQARVMSWLKTSAFKEYEPLGNIGLNDLANVVKVLERFGDMISIKVEGSLMTIEESNKKVEVELIAENFLSTDTGEPDLKFDDVFTIPIIKIAEIIKDVSLNKDASILLETSDKKVMISNTGKYKFRHVINAPTAKGGVKAKFGNPFICAVTNLSANLELSLKNDYPVKIMEKTDNSVITLIVAPLVDN